MFGVTTELRFHLYSQPTDMRKSFDGLCGLITKDLSENPTSGTVYIFINRSRNKIKLLQWQQGGFVLYYKRLEIGQFELPKYDASVRGIRIDYSQLVLLVEGIAITNLHRKKRYKL